jgi:hypothetical protein
MVQVNRSGVRTEEHWQCGEELEGGATRQKHTAGLKGPLFCFRGERELVDCRTDCGGQIGDLRRRSHPHVSVQNLRLFVPVPAVRAGFAMGFHEVHAEGVFLAVELGG